MPACLSLPRNATRLAVDAERRRDDRAERGCRDAGLVTVAPHREDLHAIDVVRPAELVARADHRIRDGRIAEHVLARRDIVDGRVARARRVDERAAIGGHREAALEHERWRDDRVDTGRELAPAQAPRRVVVQRAAVGREHRARGGRARVEALARFRREIEDAHAFARVRAGQREAIAGRRRGDQEEVVTRRRLRELVVRVVDDRADAGRRVRRSRTADRRRRPRLARRSPAARSSRRPTSRDRGTP